jgi:hypothetical protein
MQRLSSREADRLGRLSQPLLLRKGRSHDVPIGCGDVFELAERAFRCPSERLASCRLRPLANEAAYPL